MDELVAYLGALSLPLRLAGFRGIAIAMHLVVTLIRRFVQALGGYRSGKMPFLGFGTNSGPHYSWTAGSNQWNSATCPIKRPRTKTT
jgi:hypothetical protein